jgi:hydrogenase maturation protease
MEQTVIGERMDFKTSVPPPLLIIGLGNPILGDDGVGWRVAEQVKLQLESTPDSEEFDLEIDLLCLGGLSLMERLVGYHQVILIDSILTSQNPLGSISIFPLEKLPNFSAGHLCSAHDTSLQNALELGHSMGAVLPDCIMVVAIEAKLVYDFSEQLSVPVAAAVPLAAQAVMDLAHQLISQKKVENIR